jgi:cytosine/adenosine deaminase-related metal-dependent hydrolase
MFISADKIHDGKQWLPERTVLEIDATGRIIAVHQDCNALDVQYYEGMICPGFVNAHCHIELSHLQSAIPEHTGLTAFLLHVMRQRNDFTEEQKSLAHNNACDSLIRNGVVAVGDIANTTDTLPLRHKKGLHWRTFVECIGFAPERAAVSFDFAQQTFAAFQDQLSADNQLMQSIVPHAPYSVSQNLFALIAAHQPSAILSIHNQESAAENELYQYKTGAFLDFLQQIGIDHSSFQAAAHSSLQQYARWIPSDKPLLLVHNTFANAVDIAFAQERFKQLYWCLCPNANMYIENRLPDIPLLQAAGAAICIGTDSLASNHQLSVMAELLTIKAHYPDISWEVLLRWATYNGACALQMDQHIGRIAVDQQPGLVWIQSDYSIQKLY